MNRSKGRRASSLLAPTVFVSVAMLALAGCRQKSATPEAGAPPPLVEVGVVTLATSPVTLTRELPGRTSAFRMAEVRARVDGIVLKRLFEEGADVKEGQVLYEIDAAPYRALLDRAKASLARAEANLVSVRLQAERFKELVSAHAVSKQDYDNAVASQQALEAEVAASRAALLEAEINLGYTQITAPVSGRIGRSEVTEGAYVRQSQATLLAVIQQIDPIYVDVVQSSNDVLRLKRDIESGRLQTADGGRAKVTLLLDDGTSYREEGTLQFSDVTVDPRTASITLRAIFPNKNSDLLPGMFVRARLQEGVDPQGLLVPQQGVTRNQRGQATALIVGAEDKVELRELVTDRAVGAQWLVSAGLEPGDRVIVQNLQRIRPGAQVKPVPATNLGPDGTITAK